MAIGTAITLKTAFAVGMQVFVNASFIEVYPRYTQALSTYLHTQKILRDNADAAVNLDPSLYGVVSAQQSAATTLQELAQEYGLSASLQDLLVGLGCLPSEDSNSSLSVCHAARLDGCHQSARFGQWSISLQI